jgi:DNA-binding transcriptional MerR regulator
MPTARRKHAKQTAEVVIPEKLYFRIGEVSELAKLPTYVLRYWETEFGQLRPTKSSTGQRMYRRKDVECVMHIRRLLYEEGFTIAGARERLREEQRQPRAAAPVATPVPIDSVAPPAPLVATAPAATKPAQADEAQPSLFPHSASTTDAATQEELRRVRHQLSELLAMLR